MKRRSTIRPVVTLGALALVAGSLVPLAASAAEPAAAAPNTWQQLSAAPETSGGAGRALRPARFQRWQLDSTAYTASLAAGTAAPSVVTLPGPDGGLVRFAVRATEVLAPGLAAAHPEIGTWAGTGLDDPAASVRLDVGSLGLHASVRSPAGNWYVDPYYTRDRGAYLSYWGRDLANAHGTFVEGDGDALAQAQAALGDAAPQVPAAPPSTGPRTGERLRTYRLALVSDPSYAEFFGAENVTAAKVALINRVDQVYEDDLAIRLQLIDGTDRLNLDTPAMAFGDNGPCGPQACYTRPSLRACTIPAIFRTNNVLARLVGASAYDVGHLALGNSGGGVAGLGVVGGAGKAIGCTGVPDPVGDYYAVDYVAHELGHQFGGNHTFNGVRGACAGGNRNAGTSVEPGSGSSIMAYAGICARDDLQPHSDPYFSERSQAEIQAYVAASLPALDEAQAVDLRGLDAGDSFALSFRGQQTSRITRGTASYTAAGIAAALERLPGLPAGTVTVTGQPGAEQPDERGFQVRFGGTLAGTDLPALRVVAERGTTGSTAELRQGGPARNAGTVTRTGNTPPVVAAPDRHVLPLRTPFALTGRGSDADGDVLTYLWEQNDPGGERGTFLLDPDKRDGPLFRQFGHALDAQAYQPGTYGSPGENTAPAGPRRVFPDMAQVLAGNTNARTGDCEGSRGEVAPAPRPLITCYSEFLPTRAYVGLDGQPALHFRLTARDNRFGGGGVASDDTTLVLARQAGPFLVTSQAGGQSYAPGSRQDVRWDVAGTDVAPVGTAQVRITMSRDGGRSFPVVLAEATANDGQQPVTIPAGATSSARIRVEAVGNVFFAVNGGEFAVTG